MLPAKPNILKCPHCDGLRRVNALWSGNTLGIIQWSDFKVYYPMLPMISSVLRCPICNKYHLYHESQIVGKCKTEGNSSWGHLSYKSLKEAFKQLKPIGEDEITLRFMLLWGFNDLYGNPANVENLSKEYLEEQEYFTQNAKAIISLCPNNDFLRAELHRELGEFDECINILKQSSDIDKSSTVYQVLLSKAQQEDSKIFIVTQQDEDCYNLREPIIKDDVGCIYDPSIDSRPQSAYTPKFQHFEDDEDDDW